MKNPPLPVDELDRIKALDRYCVMDSPRESTFDGITKLASEICNAPISLVSLLDSDRQWFKSRVGLDAVETPRNISFCQFAIMGNDIYEITNALENELFSKNPLVTGDPNIRFYAGVPLKDEDGYKLGTLCVIDREPKKLTNLQKDSLRLLANQVVALLTLRKRNIDLEDSTKDFTRFFDLSIDLMCVANTDGKFHSVSTAFTRVLGYSKEELEGAPFTNFIHPDDLEKTFKEVENLAKGAVTISFENRYKCKDGSYVHLSWNASPDTVSGNLYAIARDITEEKSQQEELMFKEQELQNRILAINKSNATIELDLNGVILKANDIFCDIMGYSEEELLGSNHKMFVDKEEEKSEEYNSFWKELNKGEFQKGEFKRFAKDGSVRWISGNYNPIKDLNGKAYKVLKIARDITEQKKIQEELKVVLSDLEKKNVELDQFGYIVSHDLKAPLRAINNLAEWIVEDMPDMPKDVEANFKTLRGRVLRMENMINGVLEYSKIGRAKIEREKIDVTQLLNQIIDAIVPSNGFEVNIEGTMPIINSEPILLEQIFSNLISNSVKYNDKETGEINCSYRSIPGFHEFTVSDNGPGIEEEYYEKVFLVFQTIEARDKKESTGIGLSIVKKIIEEKGGYIRIESVVGDGVSFIFAIPKQ
mgnify:FL=1